MHILSRSFYHRSTEIVAKELLGKKLVRYIHGYTLSGIITETEAYGHEDDPASHAFRGKTKRTVPMFGPVGYTYVYFIYGNYHCLNIVAKDASTPAGAVLIRGLKPLEGIEQMKQWRNTEKIDNLASGPGKIGQALHLTRADNNIDVTQKGPLYVCQTSLATSITSGNIACTPRIGISKAQDHQWRFVLKKKLVSPDR